MAMPETADNPLTFEKVWAMFQEAKDLVKVSAQETDRRLAEAAKRSEEMDRRLEESARRSAETDRRRLEEAAKQRKEAAKRSAEINRLFEEAARRSAETDKILAESAKRREKADKKFNKRFGDLTNRFGQMVEHLVVPSIKKKFNGLGAGFSFNKTFKNLKITDAEERTIAEIDLVLESFDSVMAVEVKVKPTVNHVDRHLKRIQVLRDDFRLRNDNRTLYGAMAGAIMDDAVRDYAHQQGLYVLEQSGDTMQIVTADNFTAQTW